MVTVVNLPAVPFAQCEFDPIRPSSSERMEGRRVEGQSTGTPYWVAKYRTDFLTREQAGLMAAFRMECSDNGGLFLAYDIDHQRPLKYLGGFPVGFTGNATVRSFINSLSVEVQDLPAGFQLVKGDYVELRRSTSLRSLHIVTAAATANAAGVVSLSIKYPVDLEYFKTPCTAHFYQAACLMQIDPGSWSAPKSMADRNVSFTATEMFFDE